MAISRKKEKRILPVVVVLVLVAILLLIAVLTENKPNTLRVDLTGFFNSKDGSFAVVRDNVLSHEDFIVRDGVVYTSVSYLQEKLNKRFFYDQTEEMLLYTLPWGTHTAGLSSIYEEAPVLINQGKTVYVQLKYIAQFTAVSWELIPEPRRLVMRTVFGESGEVEALGETVVRTGPSVRNPILCVLNPGEKVNYLEEQAEWNYICTKDGIPGYVAKSEVSAPRIVQTEAPYKELPYESRPALEDNICLMWHQVKVKAENADLEKLLAKTHGITVVSPTWLFLKDHAGNFDSSADPSYVEKAHARGIKVWILLNNMDHSIYGDDLISNFNVTSHRRNLIQGIMRVLKETGADGINVDIESLPSAGGPGFLQFIRELSVACHNAGYVLSVDNYVPSPWTAHYDRQEQALFADYLIVMAYDEHYAGSAAGSSASLPFVIKGVEDSLKQVPAKKLICGVPFFTRLWVGGGDKPASTHVAMNEIDGYISRYNLSPVWNMELGQYYAEFSIEGELARLWIEDAESMALRLENLTSYGLAGLSAWCLGMESDDVWSAFKHFYNQNTVK